MRRKAEDGEATFRAPEFEALADAVRGHAEPEGAERALAAFREFRAAEGAGPQRPRRRDDWRPSRRSPVSASLKAALGAALATLALGGVALAVGTGALHVPFGKGDGAVESPRPSPGVDAPRLPGSGGKEADRSSPPPASSPPAPARAPRSQAALCHAWGSGNGQHRGKAFQRLADAAGGESAVESYCAALSGAGDTAPSSPGKQAGRTVPEQPNKPPTVSLSRGRSAEHARSAGKHE
ncbi:hypothetical protein ACFYY2_23765 [Streptomyces sp. NPDC001822]|uniref:hypothetical protein n=1 Tax=Streptomyces sp. NPDC001822 TaxID=3364614 RepID=UPI0036856BA2